MTGAEIEALSFEARRVDQGHRIRAARQKAKAKAASDMMAMGCTISASFLSASLMWYLRGLDETRD